MIWNRIPNIEANVTDKSLRDVVHEYIQKQLERNDSSVALGKKFGLVNIKGMSPEIIGLRNVLAHNIDIPTVKDKQIEYSDKKKNIVTKTITSIIDYLIGYASEVQSGAN